MRVGDIFHVKFSEKRKMNGLLEKPPKLFVVCYDEELDKLSFEQISWRIAQDIAKKKMKLVSDSLEKERDEDRVIYHLKNPLGYGT